MQVPALRIIPPPQGAQRHLVSIGFVAAIHVALITALINMGIIDVVLPKPEPPIVNVTLPKEGPTQPPLPQPSEPSAQTVENPEVRPPVIDYSEDAPPLTGRTGNEITTGGGGGLTTAASSIDRTHTIPPYPPVERRLGREGVVTVRLTIAETGFVSDVTLVKSSGFKGLDDAALAWIKKHWRYKPALRNGTAVASTTTAQMKFELH
jgi:protein TonB